jgi:FimV-like protein
MAILLLLMVTPCSGYAQEIKQNERLYEGRYGPIVSSDSLWDIARKVRLDDNLTIYQVMYALFEQNPQSFMDENYNHLLNGTYLYIPAFQKIKHIDVDVARAQGKLHEDLWAQIKWAQITMAKIKRTLKALYISTTPSDAQVMVLNMKANYDYGMKLQIGCYQVEVNKTGYQTKRAWVALGIELEQQSFNFTLKKQNGSVLKMRKPIIGQYGPVKPADSIWRIAANIRPDDKVSIYQVMYSLYRHNPDSFVDENYNQLKAGSFLTIPSIKVQKKTNYNKARLKAELDDNLWAAASEGEPTKQIKTLADTTLAKMSDDYWGVGQCR